MKVGVRDIAAAVGVSPATVSNALNGKPGVSREVEEKIRGLAREMGYQLPRPAASARRFVRLIVMKVHGMVVMDTQFFGELIEAIQRRCLEERLELVISHIDMSTDKDWPTQVAGFCAEECAGSIVLATELGEKELELFRQSRSPVIILDNACPHLRFHSVCMDNLDAGYKAAGALYDAGHRRIGMIDSSVAFSNMTQRRVGYMAYLQQHEDTAAPSLWPVRPTIEGAYEDMLALLESGRALPTAFFAGNDIMAIGAMRALKERGIRVPEDVSLIGMDDTDLCLACSPQLSTIRVYRKELGRMAVELLLSVVPGMTDSRVSATNTVDVVPRGSIRQLGAEG